MSKEKTGYRLGPSYLLALHLQVQQPVIYGKCSWDFNGCQVK